MQYVVLFGLAAVLASTGPASPVSGTGVAANPEMAFPVDTLGTRWVASAGESRARYRVREQLAGFDFPNDAIGETDAVSGAIVVADDGTVISDQSEFRVQLATLATDNERRDGYVRSRTLEVEEYPEAVLVPTRFSGLPGPLPESGSATFRLEGNLTLHGVTKATVWEVTAEFAPGKISGLATTSFQFDTFGIAVPSVARVLSVDDNIRLELQFELVSDKG